jgi:hypothetical protein
VVSNILIEALTTLNAQHNGAKGLAPDAIAQAWEAVQAALLDAAAAKANASRAQIKRQAENPNANAGRPASIYYTVAMGSLWELRVLGAKDALELVAQTLTENPGNGPPPTAGSLAVQLSRSGHWYRHLVTADGEHGLTVTKARSQNP